MDTTWFIIGIIVGAGLLALWFYKGAALKPIQWLLVVLWVALAVFSLAMILTFSGEPYPGSSQATAISALVFGGLSVLTGVLLFRRVLTAW